MNLENTQTLKNLAHAYAMETLDGARYQFVRKQAKAKGQQFIASTLKMLAANEMAHAKVLFDLITSKCKKSVPNAEIKMDYPIMADGGDFTETFKILAENEKHEGEKTYVEFAKVARKEGLDIIAKFFDMLAEVEREHAMLLNKIYLGLKNDTLWKSKEEMRWKCVSCGYEAMGKSAWKTCHLCGVEQGFCMTPALILIESDIKTNATTVAGENRVMSEKAAAKTKPKV